MTAPGRTLPAGVDVFVIPNADLAVTTGVVRLLDGSPVHGAGSRTPRPRTGGTSTRPSPSARARPAGSASDRV